MGGLKKYYFGKLKKSIYYNNERFATNSSLGNVAIFFKPDGTTMYIQIHGGTYSYKPVQYTLSTPWDVSTATFVKACNVSLRGASLFFKPDGTKIFIDCDSSGDAGLGRVRSISLSTPWDVGTATIDAGGFNPGFIGGGAAGSFTMFFDTTGTKMYINNGSSINQYSLSIPYDLTTPVLDYTVSIGNLSNCAITFSPDGYNVYYPANHTSMHHKVLSVPWDLRTVILSQSVNNSAYIQSTNGAMTFIKPDGTKIYHIGYNATPGYIVAFNLRIPFKF